MQDREREEAIIKFVNEMLEANLISPSESEYWSQALLTKKPNGDWRFCIDFRNLNKASLGHGWPLPKVDEMIQRIGSKKCKYFAKLDLTSGY